MEDKIAEKFLREMNHLAQEELERARERIGREYEIWRPDAEQSFLRCLESAAGHYIQLEAGQITGPAVYLAISYLRTAILVEMPPYRIDLYDGRGQSSPVECGCGWNFLPVSSCLQEIRKKLAREFARQTRVEGVQLDKLLYFVGEELYSFSQDLLVSMLEKLFPRIRQIRGLEQVERFWVGEFMGAALKTFFEEKVH